MAKSTSGWGARSSLHNCSQPISPRKSSAFFWTLPVSAIHTGHLHAHWKNIRTHTVKINLKKRENELSNWTERDPPVGRKVRAIPGKPTIQKPEFWELNHPNKWYVSVVAVGGRTTKGNTGADTEEGSRKSGAMASSGGRVRTMWIWVYTYRGKPDWWDQSDIWSSLTFWPCISHKFVFGENVLVI